MVKTEPAEFVEGIIVTAVDAPITEIGVCSGGLLLSVEASVTEGPMLVTAGTETAGLGVDEASGIGTKAVNVLENVKADPAEFVNVTTNTELVVIREGLRPVVEVVSKVSAEGRADSVSIGMKLFDDSPADVGFGICKVTDVWTVDPEALVVAYVKTVVDTAAVVTCSSVLEVWLEVWYVKNGRVVFPSDLEDSSLAAVEVVLASDLDDSVMTAVVLRNGAVEAVAKLPLSDSKVPNLSVVLESLFPKNEVVG